MSKKRSLLDEYQFPGFRPKAGIQGVFGDPKARVIRLKRMQKKRFVDVVALFIEVITTKGCEGFEIYLVGMRGFIWKWRFGVFYVGSAGK